MVACPLPETFTCNSYFPASSLALRRSSLWSPPDRDGDYHGDLERYSGWQHGRRGLGIRTLPWLEVEGTVSLD